MAAEDASFLRAQLHELRPELAALGLSVDNTQAPVAEWRLPHSNPPSAARPAVQDWWRSRISSVNAFWTDPSSPAVRLAMVADVSGRPRIAPPRVDGVNFLSDWTPPRPVDDFTVSSPAAVLPANQRIALHPSLGEVFAYAPHRRVHGDHMPLVGHDTYASLSTVHTMAKASASRIAAPRLDLPSMPRSPLLQPTAAQKSEASPLLSRSLTSPSGWQWSASYRTSSLYMRTAVEPLASDSTSRSFLTGHDALGAGTNWTHFAAVADYPISIRNFDVNVKFDEWTFGERSALYGNNSGRGLGLDRARLQDAGLNLNYSVDPSLSVHGGYIYTRTSGLYSAGLDASAANLSVSEDRGYPYVGFDYKLSRDARWNVNIRFYNTPLDMGGGANATRSPVNLTDPQVTTEFKVRF